MTELRTAREIIADALYQRNVDADEAYTQADQIINELIENGYDIFR